MNVDLVRNVLADPSEANIEALFEDRDTVVWIDWREEDDIIVEYFEDLLKTGRLTAEYVDADTEAGFDLYITYGDERVRAPLVVGFEDRHITVVTLNELLAPEYEIRFCIDSNGADTLAFVPLETATWAKLEEEFGDAVAGRFYRLAMRPNVFTDPLPF